MSQVDLNKYKDFVREVTSSESLSSMQMYNRIIDIETTESKMKVNMAQLMTGAVGICAEGGEFMEIVKKCANDVIAENVKKLEKRYPGGEFDPYYSENRQDGDL